MSRDILKKIDDFMSEKEEDDESKHLTKKQEKLPEKLKKKIIASKKG